VSTPSVLGGACKSFGVRAWDWRQEALGKRGARSTSGITGKRLLETPARKESSKVWLPPALQKNAKEPDVGKQPPLCKKRAAVSEYTQPPAACPLLRCLAVLTEELCVRFWHWRAGAGNATFRNTGEETFRNFIVEIFIASDVMISPYESKAGWWYIPIL